MRRNVLSLTAIVASLLGASDGPVTVQCKLTSREAVERRVGAALNKNADREAKLRELFEEAGCPAIEREPVRHSRNPNVICTVAGETGSVIVVGAHFDHAREGMGVIDNWSGAALLPSLLESTRSQQRRHTFVFIGFTDEEKGLVGSRYYVDRLGKEGRGNLRAMINFDSIGAGPAEVQRATADAELLKLLVNVAAAMKLPLRYMDVNRVGTSDFEAFRRQRVPTIIFHSITQQNLRLLHTSRDNADALNPGDYYDTYRTAAIYLAYLDLTLGSCDQGVKH
jgi:Zn-dependent M28 family amino/carboxypeptidase